MKTKNIFTVGIMSVAMFMASCGNTAPTEAAAESDATAQEEEAATFEDISVDANESKVMWKGEMMGMYAHEGTINFTGGTFTVDQENITAGHFEIDMSTIVPTDENYNPEEGHTQEKLVEHLSSADFFDITNHPNATYEISSVEGTTATGTLTIRGKSSEEAVENITVSNVNGKVKVTGTLTFDRKKYDVSFDNPVKEMVLSDEISLTIELMGS